MYMFRIFSPCSLATVVKQEMYWSRALKEFWQYMRHEWIKSERYMRILLKLFSNPSGSRTPPTVCQRAPGPSAGPKIGTGPGPVSGLCANFWPRARALGHLAHCRRDYWATLNVFSCNFNYFPFIYQNSLNCCFQYDLHTTSRIIFNHKIRWYSWWPHIFVLGAFYDNVFSPKGAKNSPNFPEIVIFVCDSIDCTMVS